MSGERVKQLVQQAVTTAGEVELYHMEWYRRGQVNVLRVSIDKPGGVTVADCERVSRELGVLLDVDDPIRNRYTLEVSSPGVDRALHIPRHYQAVLDREVEVVPQPDSPAAGRKWVGRLISADEAGFRIAAEGGEQAFAYAEVKSARLRFTI